MRGRPCELFTDPTVLYIDRLNLGARYGPENIDGAQAAARLRNDRPATMSVGEFERQLELVSQTLLSVEESRAQMRELIEERVAQLKERFELVKLREERDRALALKEAAVDVTPDGRNRLRYELSHLRAKDASLRQLRALQEARRKNEAAQPGPGPGPQPESDPSPGDAEGSVAEEGVEAAVQSEPKPQSSPEPADGYDTPSEPVAGVADAVAGPVGDRTPAVVAEDPAEPSKVATAVNSDRLVATPPGAGETGPEGRRPDRTGTTQILESTKAQVASSEDVHGAGDSAPTPPPAPVSGASPADCAGTAESGRIEQQRSNGP
jgi:hypothetical protein